MMRNDNVVLGSVLAVVLGLAGCQEQAPRPVAKPVGTTPVTQPQAPAPATLPARDYGIERARIVSSSDEIVSMLGNGSVVIAKRVAGSPVLSVRGYVGTGGVYEGKWLGGGLSHLLEHLVAGGSTVNRSEAENRALLQKIGNNSNAYTSADHTAYFVNTTPQNLDDAVDLLTGWVLGAAITPDEFAREYQVVQRELEMGRGEPSRQFYYLMAMNRYHVSPARVPVIGYQAVIQGLTRDDVYSYYRSAYQPNNMVFAVAGDLEPEQMLKAFQKHLGKAAPGRAFDHNIAQEPEVLTPRTVVATMPKIGEAKVAMEYPTIKLYEPDLYALDLLASVLSDGEGSLLVREIRDREQLATGIDASSATPTYVQGSFMVMLQTPPEKVQQAQQAVLKLLADLKDKPLDAEMIERAKTQMRMGLLKSRQTAADIAAGMASDYMSAGDVHFSDKYLQRISQVTAVDLQAVARKYFDSGRLVTTIMLPSEYATDLPHAEDLIRSGATQPTTAKAATAAETVRRTVLDNGTILLVKRVPTSDLVSVRMYAMGGLTAENDVNNGIGNLSMRLLSRGTQTRSARQIAEFFDSVGTSMEAGCGNNTWFWSTTCVKDDLDKTLDVFSDVVRNPSFPDGEVEMMRKRVLAAIASQDADWSGQAMRYFRAEYFGPAKSPYRFPVIGSAKTVQALSAGDLRQWYQEKVLASRRVLAIYGNVDETQAQAMAAKYLGGGQKIADATAPTLPAASPAQTTESPLSAASSMPQVNVTAVDIQKTQQPLAGIVIGYDSHSLIGEEAIYPITVADTLASGYGYPTGYLHETLRGQGLVYVVHAQNWPGRNEKTPGTFFVYAGCEPDKVNQVVDLILLNIARLQGTDADIQTDWFKRARQLTITEEAMANETVADQTATAALDELWGLGYNHQDEFAPKIDTVTLGEVRQISRQRLRDCVVTICTPAPELVQVGKGPRQYSSFPPVDLTPRGVTHDMPVGGGK